MKTYRELQEGEFDPIEGVDMFAFKILFDTMKKKMKDADKKLKEFKKNPSQQTRVALRSVFRDMEGHLVGIGNHLERKSSEKSPTRFDRFIK